ncbi:hypothetical protein [Nostoc sp. CMAA1605]|uniref:hypothetical protein n=1 Tax=Nostoc sp. CMAA1605 TaxID=2055159 RepID=UPI001F2B8899|nr:hypothetical protein [Nostoc sp. CMAA1605]MCF4970084.1 hypothetical protein [Nostoc sp. CMAA1605]
MQFIKIILIALALIVNFTISQPAWASKDFTKGADYTEVTQEINQLLSVQNTPEQTGYTSEQLQARLAQLQAQKSVMETAKKRAQCLNETGKTLGVYANKGKKSPTQLYYLAAGQITDDDWDCDGIYLPAGSQVVLNPNAPVEELTEPIAVKFVDGTQSIAQTNPTTGAIEFNLTPAKVFKTGETNWVLPTLSQAEIDTQVPSKQLID